MKRGKFNRRLYLSLLVISSTLLAKMALAQEATNESQTAKVKASKVPKRSSRQSASWYQWLGPQRNGISPETGLVEEGRARIEPGGNNSRSLAVFNAEDGNLLWTSGSDEMGYSSAIGIDFAGQCQAVFFTGEGLMAVAPQNGQGLWRPPWPTDYKINAAIPVFVPPDKIFISTGYGVGGALVQLIAGDERTTTVLIWKNKTIKTILPLRSTTRATSTASMNRSSSTSMRQPARKNGKPAVMAKVV